MRVLVADDDVPSRLILKSVLRKWGYQPESVADGRAALEILQQPDPPRIAILDWEMPEMDGIEVCQQLRETVSKQVYVLLLTGHDQTSDIVQGLEAGANDYLTKPFNPGELKARVDVGRRVIELQVLLETRMYELEQALAHVKTLQGLIPICMYCKNIRSDIADWKGIEEYFSDHTEAEFSHSVCPDCFQKMFGELPEDMR